MHTKHELGGMRKCHLWVESSWTPHVPLDPRYLRKKSFGLGLVDPDGEPGKGCGSPSEEGCKSHPEFRTDCDL